MESIGQGSPVTKELYENNYKYTPEESDIQNIEKQDAVIQDLPRMNDLDFEECLYKKLNPKTKTNHYKCTNLEKYFLEFQKDIKQQHDMIDEEKEEIQVADIVNDNMISENEIKISKFIVEDPIEMQEEADDSKEESVDTVAADFNKKQQNESEVQECNISINASPIILDLLKFVKITQDSGSSLLDFISIEKIDEEKINGKE